MTTPPDPRRLRDAMPSAAAFVDAAREAFGAAEVNAAIRAGMRGEPGCFHAVENGREIGTPFAPPETIFTCVAADRSQRQGRNR